MKLSSTRLQEVVFSAGVLKRRGFSGAVGTFRDLGIVEEPVTVFRGVAVGFSYV